MDQLYDESWTVGSIILTLYLEAIKVQDKVEDIKECDIDLLFTKVKEVIFPLVMEVGQVLSCIKLISSG